MLSNILCYFTAMLIPWSHFLLMLSIASHRNRREAMTQTFSVCFHDMFLFLGSAREVGSSWNPWWKGNWNNHPFNEACLYSTSLMLLQLTASVEHSLWGLSWLIQCNSCCGFRAALVQRDLSDQLDFLEKLWDYATHRTLSMKPLILQIFFISYLGSASDIHTHSNSFGYFSHIGWAWKRWSRWKTWR